MNRMSMELAAARIVRRIGRQEAYTIIRERYGAKTFGVLGNADMMDFINRYKLPEDNIP